MHIIQLLSLLGPLIIGEPQSNWKENSDWLALELRNILYNISATVTQTSIGAHMTNHYNPLH